VPVTWETMDVLTPWLVGRRQLEQVCDVVTAFVEENLDPSTSPNFNTDDVDDMSVLFELLADPLIRDNQQIALGCLSTVKILSRKDVNRSSISYEGVESIVYYLSHSHNKHVGTECASSILNICYEAQNVDMLLRAGGVPPLIALLSSSEESVQAASMGAIQSICFQEAGKASIRDSGRVEDIVQLLESPSIKVRTRAVGTIHNLTSDPDAIAAVRIAGAIPMLVTLLRATQSAITGSAAGAIQNMSREDESREEIDDAGASDPLTDLLFGSDVQTQVCAVGALMNIVGPELGEVATARRNAYKRLISLSLSLGVVYHGLFTEE
jgi:hypothetical protein